MKKTVLLICILSLIIHSARSQNAHVTEIKDKNLKLILGFIDTVYFKKNEDISVTLFKISNQSGSANLPEADEVSHKYLILVSTFDDDPEQHLFSIGNFILPKILKFEKPSRDKFRVAFEYGVYNHRKKSFINISLNKVSVTSA